MTPVEFDYYLSIVLLMCPVIGAVVIFFPKREVKYAQIDFDSDDIFS